VRPCESSFGQVLTRQRRAAGLTQEMLSERSGLSVDTISALERGLHRAPRPHTVALLADALGLAGRDREDFAAAGHASRADAAVARRSCPRPAPC